MGPNRAETKDAKVEEEATRTKRRCIARQATEEPPETVGKAGARGRRRERASYYHSSWK